MNHSHRYAALCGALLASAVPALGDGELEAVVPVWEIRADLSGEGLSARFREMLLPKAPKQVAGPSLTIRGFDNPATADKDWLASLDIPGDADQLWHKLQSDLKAEWGRPDESGRWLVKDPDSGVSFVIVQSGESLKFTNAVENLSLALPPVENQAPEARVIQGYVNMRAPGAEQESRLFQLAENASFSLGSSGDGMVLDVTVDLVESSSADQIDDAVRKALDSKLLNRLSPLLPKPVLTRDSSDERERFTFTMEFDAAQTDRIINTVISQLIDEEADEPQPSQESDDSDAKIR